MPALPLDRRRFLATTALAGAVALTIAACGAGSTNASAMPMTTGMHPTSSPAMASMPTTSMPGMGSGAHDMAADDGLSAEASGLRFAPTSTTLPANEPDTFRFQIRGTDGIPITTFAPDQTKLMHLYLIRSDLTGFQHVHPTMAADGTWTANLAATPAGTYQVYTSFTAQIAGKDVPLVLSQPVTLPGTAATIAPAPASDTTTVDGYTLAVSTAGGMPMAGMTHTLIVTITRNGMPVTDLQPYLDTYAHLTAVHAGDLAFAHLHPQGKANGDHGGPTLSFAAELPRPGAWRLFLQFETAGTLHTAALTLNVG
ncbi:Secreted protein [Frankia sp. AiPs1]|uniref:hypothetical protein n=1 Tax=Frankia sp. AiPa1 TaxID=573492 RepID=UPI00202AF646|nr:hypothetical protein [Frankia sp. AiPa1]MCL9759032.1 hypothetical protein [Frankia sp. AiPa1]